jgi:hypothetical protein
MANLRARIREVLASIPAGGGPGASHAVKLKPGCCASRFLMHYDPKVGKPKKSEGVGLVDVAQAMIFCSHFFSLFS